MGEADYTKTRRAVEIGFGKLAIKPGNLAFGKLSSSWFCPLPGNPVSAMFHRQLVQPLLANSRARQPPLQAPRLRVRRHARLKSRQAASISARYLLAQHRTANWW